MLVFLGEGRGHQHRTTTSNNLAPGPLANLHLFLHWYNLPHLLLEGCPWEKLRFPNGQAEEKGQLQGLDVHVLDQAAQRGDKESFLDLKLDLVSKLHNLDPYLDPGSHHCCSFQGPHGLLALLLHSVQCSLRQAGEAGLNDRYHSC